MLVLMVLLAAVVVQARQISPIEELAQLESQLEDELRVKRFFLGGDKDEDEQSSKNSSSEDSDDDDSVGLKEIIKMLIDLFKKILRLAKQLVGFPTIGLNRK